MYKELKNNMKIEKGITLVALVVTIVVLLILAFISISLLMGENGIINKASESKEETIKAKEREMIQLTYQDLEMEYTLYGTDITADRVWEKLKEYDNNIKVEMKAKEELGETEIVVEKNSGEEYAEIVYEETGHKYAGSLVINENKARYEVTYNANRGYGGPTKQIKIEGVPLTITTETPQRKGYSFKGWSKDSTAVVAEYTSGSKYTEDTNITLYAVWQLREDIEPVAQIGDTKYPSIQEAIYDCSQEAGDTTTTIILLKNTEEEFRTFEGQNIILDLQGYTVTSESTGALCTNNGKIQIENGELRSNNGTTIINNGEITIGNNSNGIDDNTPVLYGKNIGIENNGIFNFYDGKIQGIVPIQGTTTNTPEEYGPVQTGYENGITTIQLRILTQYEARIGWVYYETLQGAIDIAKAKQTVTLIKDLQLKNILEVSEDKDVILDLYGYSLTILSSAKTVIKNYGNLEITDTSQEEIGNITNNSSNYGIRNEGKKTLKISKGIINSYNGIYNLMDGTIEIAGGIINGRGSSASYGIYNNSQGKVKIIGGEIRGYIYNSIGEIEVIGGNLINNSVGAGGIRNTNTGIIKIMGGEISTSTSYGIYNTNGSIIISGGSISNDSDNSYNTYGIYNLNGTVEITGGKIDNRNSYNNTTRNTYSYGIYNSNGIVELYGGEIDSRANGRYTESYGVYNTDSGNVKINDTKINSSDFDNAYGIYNLNGTIEIIGGEITGTTEGYNGNSYGIYNLVDGSTIIGANSNGMVSQDNPYIKGEYTGTSSNKRGIGLYNRDGNIEFYNGKIQGNIALYGSILKIRENYKIKKEENDTEAIYLVEKDKIENIVQIGQVQYNSLQDAINSIGESEEKIIQVIKDFEIDKCINFNKNVTLDLNGFTITNNFYKIENSKNLKIIDTNKEVTGKIEAMNTIIGITNKETGRIEISGGEINGSGYGIYNIGEASVLITGGIISSNNSYNQNYGIYNDSTGTIEMTGGEINNSINYGIYNNTSGKVQINGGIINAKSYGIYNNSIGSIEILEGEINNSIYGIYNQNSGSVKFIKGIIKDCTYGIYNYESGTIEIIEGEINSERYGIYNYGIGNICVTEGVINASNNDSSKYIYAYGIYNASTGTITIGVKGDGKISEEIPDISGKYTGFSSTFSSRYGIYNPKGKIYFYDGKIEGSTKAINSSISGIEDSTYLNSNEDETILTLSTEPIPIVQIGETMYSDLQVAIDSVGEEKTTIKVIKNITLVDAETIIVPNTKNIVLDLNGYKIISDIKESLIQNEGILEITDTSEEKDGIITTNEEKTINNTKEAKLIITEGIIENKGKYVIYNEGNIVLQGGNVNISNDNVYGIYNTNLGTIELNSGNININNSNSYGIYNESIKTIKINGGKITGNTSICYGVYNANSGYIEMNGGEIDCYGSSRCYGIYNADNGKIKIIYGTIKSSIATNKNAAFGIYNDNNGTVEIIDGIIEAEHRGGSDSYVVTNISNRAYGIYNYSEGTIIINGGTIIGKHAKSTTGYGVYNINGNLYFYNGTIKGRGKGVDGTITKINQGKELLVETEIIDSKNYETLTLEEITEKAVIVNENQYDSIQEAIEICNEKESTIKLLRNLMVGEILKIKEGQNVTIDLNGYTISNYIELENEGILKIVDTSLEQTGKITSLSNTIIVNSASIELQGGTIFDSTYGIKNTGTLEMNGGNILNNTYGIYNNTNGSVSILNGTINSNTYGIYNNSKGNVNIEGGTISSNTYAIYNYSSSLTTEINSGTITSNEYGIYNYSGTTTISGTGIANNTYGVYVAGGTINIKEGANIQSETGVQVSKGTLNIGKTGKMNGESPVITGETYGLRVSSTGTVYMYDGQVKGKEGATEGYITYTEEGYVVANREEGEYKVNYLALGGTASAVAQVNGVSYSSLQSAINSITGGEEQTITLLNGIIAEEIYEIAEGQNIILDMNGKTITTDLETAIKNSGNLTIVDTSNKNVASIVSTTGVAIENSGTLTIGEDEGIENPNLITIEGATHGITNTGTLNVYDGTIRPE